MMHQLTQLLNCIDAIAYPLLLGSVMVIAMFDPMTTKKRRCCLWTMAVSFGAVLCSWLVRKWMWGDL